MVVPQQKKARKHYHLYGEYDASLAKDPGPYHKGIDLKCSTSGATIRTAHSGNLKHNDQYGAACIQATYGSSLRTYTYAHMTNLEDEGSISYGTVIGKQGKKGADGEHLHFEVRTLIKIPWPTPHLLCRHKPLRHIALCQ